MQNEPQIIPTTTTIPQTQGCIAPMEQRLASMEQSITDLLYVADEFHDEQELVDSRAKDFYAQQDQLAALVKRVEACERSIGQHDEWHANHPRVIAEHPITPPAQEKPFPSEKVRKWCDEAVAEAKSPQKPPEPHGDEYPKVQCGRCGLVLNAPRVRSVDGTHFLSVHPCEHCEPAEEAVKKHRETIEKMRDEIWELGQQCANNMCAKCGGPIKPPEPASETLHTIEHDGIEHPIGTAYEYTATWPQLDALAAKVDALHRALGLEEPGGSLADWMREMVRDIGALREEMRSRSNEQIQKLDILIDHAEGGNFDDLAVKAMKAEAERQPPAGEGKA